MALTAYDRSIVRIALLLVLSSPSCADSGANPDVETPPMLTLPPVGAFLNGAFPSRTPTSAVETTWNVEPAFPDLDLTDTLVIASNPANERLYVGSRNGLIVSFENRPDAQIADTFLDLRDRVAVVWDGGFLGLVFHPDFGNEASPYGRTLYVYYSSHCPLDGTGNAPDLDDCDDAYPRGSTLGFFNTYLRLSRFEASSDGLAADGASEQVLINIRLYNDSHRGGGMTFRDDGYLYLTIGDQFRYDTAQDISETLEGGVLRLAVDITDDGDGTWGCPEGSHAPRRAFDSSDEISGRYYCIPEDNPWLDAAGTLFEEYCSIGHRNPHRLARDPVTDRLWSGEVGEAAREEINIIECGNNYGWPFREGLIPGVRPEPSTFLGRLTDPVIDFTRNEANALIGGYVYRGTRLPELQGDYLAGDFVTSRIWAVSLDEETMTATKRDLTNFTPGNLATWGQDADGELYMGSVVGTAPLFRLVREVLGPVPDPPALLSETGAFSSTMEAEASDFWLPYALNQPFWSDGARKTRFLAVPSDEDRDSESEKVAFSKTGNWQFPHGTVLMKHFELPLDATDPGVTTRIETRFLVRGVNDRWYGVTYRWRDDQTDADLLDSEETAEYSITDVDGTTRTQAWYFPSRADCLECHREGSGGALGPRTHQLNGDFTYPSTMESENQLFTWNGLGLFTPRIDTAALSSTLPAAPSLEDVTAPLEDRARSWLDSNCSYCHRPGQANAGFDARYTTPFAAQRYVWTGVRDDLGNPDTVVIYPGEPELSAIWQRAAAVGPIAMPPLAKARSEEPAVDLLAEWIARIDPEPLEPGLFYEYFEVDGMAQLPDFDGLVPLESGFATGPDISLRRRDDNFAFRFSGYVEITTGGEYTFYAASDDGSQLFIDGALVVDNDGLHALEEKSGTVELSAGYHSITISMFEQYGGEILEVSWKGPDTADAKGPLAPDALYFQRTELVGSSPTLSALPGRRDRVGDEVVLDLEASDEDGDRLYFDAMALPPGLTIDHSTGRISGTLTEPGEYVATISVSDGPEVALTTLSWIVEPI